MGMGGIDLFFCVKICCPQFNCLCLHFDNLSSTVKKKAKRRNLYNQVPHLTKDTIWESGKNTRKHHTQESQEVSPFPAGDHKAARNRQDIITNTNTKHQ